MLVEPRSPPAALEVGDDFLAVVYAELLAFHRRFDDRREGYRPSLREWVEQVKARAVSAEHYLAARSLAGSSASGSPH